jgi:hypothetical protein
MYLWDHWKTKVFSRKSEDFFVLDQVTSINLEKLSVKLIHHFSPK